MSKGRRTRIRTIFIFLMVTSGMVFIYPVTAGLDHTKPVVDSSFDYSSDMLTKAIRISDSIVKYSNSQLLMFNAREVLVKDTGIARSFELMGDYYRGSGDYLLSIESFLKALRFYDQTSNLKAKADCNSGLGNVLLIQKYYDEALRFFSQASQLNQSLGEWQSLAENQKDIAWIYFYKEQIDKADEYAAKALNLSSSLNDSLLIAQSLQIQGDILFHQNKNEKARECHQKAMQILQEISYEGPALIVSCLSLGQLYYIEKHYPKAVASYEKAIQLSEQYNQSSQKAKALLGLSEVMEALGQHQSAFTYFIAYSEIEDSIAIAESRRVATEIEILYENEKQLAHIDILKSEKLIEQAEMDRQEIFLQSLIIFFVLLLLIVIILFFNNRQKYSTNHLLLKKNLEIFDQKKELEEKNKVLRDQKEEIHTQNSALEELNKELERYNQELEMLSLVARETDNAVIIADKDGNYEWVNEGFVKLFGYGFNELVSRGHNLYKASSVNNIQEIISMCLKLHSSVAYESSDIDRNGKIIWLQTTLTPIFDGQGGLKKIVIIESDITRLKQVEARLSELNWHLERKIEEEVQKNRQKDLLLAQQSRLAAMGEMISNIAHQWRQPLNAIGIIVQNIEDTYVYGEMTPEYIGKKVDKTMELIMFMSQTIDDFRNFFKPDKEKQLFNLKEIVNKALSFVEASFLKHDITIEKQMDDHVLCEGYPNEYTQVIINLLNNSRDALVENVISNPKVCVCLRKENGVSVLKIKDNAGGIPSSISQKIFDPYFTTRNEKKGTGLGLYMSKNIIEKNMQGRLSFENKEEGVEFSIEI